MVLLLMSIMDWAVVFVCCTKMVRNHTLKRQLLLYSTTLHLYNHTLYPLNRNSDVFNDVQLPITHPHKEIFSQN